MNERDKYFYPEYELHIGSMLYTEGISLDYYSSKTRMSDWIHIRFTEKLHKMMKLENMQKVIFKFGYDKDLHQLFSGYVAQTSQNGNEVICKDAMLKLQRQRITELYQSVSQFEYVETLLKQAGVSIGVLNAPALYRKDKVMLENINFVEALQRANTLWNTNAFFYFDAKERFYFDAPKPQIRNYVFKYGESILRCKKHQNTYEMEIIPTHVDYTNRIEVEHPQVNGAFEVIQVRFHVTSRGFPKMFLYFEE